ncbi:MAG: hypothetical protein GF353_19185 [Candidatus Lokiarchaeota archaeon]|nr:hypothetical protein [Candidatus Lokiarchaeota archaeon]
MNKLMDAKRQSRLICTKGKHMAHKYELIKDQESGVWAVECKNCKDDFSFIKNDIRQSGMNMEFKQLHKLLNENKGKNHFVYLIIIDGQVYVGVSTQSWGNRFEKEVKAAFARTKEGHRKDTYFYRLSEAIRNKIDPNEQLSMKERIKKAKEEIDLVLWQVCDTKEEMLISERFWIGATHSQFEGYGYNIGPGGEGSGLTTRIIPEAFLQEALTEGMNKNYKSLMNFLVDYLNDKYNQEIFFEDYLGGTEEIDYIISPHIIRNSIREHNDGQSLRAHKNELRDNRLNLYNNLGVQPSEIAPIFSVKEERVIYWIENLIKNNQIEKEDIIISRALREISIQEELDWTKIIKGLKDTTIEEAKNIFYKYLNNKENVKVLEQRFNKIIKSIIEQNEVSFGKIVSNINIIKVLSSFLYNIDPTFFSSNMLNSKLIN